MKGTVTPIRELKDQYVCRRCGIIRTTATGRNYDTCFDCRQVEADLANPARIERLDRRLDGPRGRPRKTHCPKGHPYSGPNLRIAPDGHRICRTCKAEQARRSYDKKKEQAAS